MVNVTILKDSGHQYKGFIIEGHAESGEPGYDLICTAVSVLSFNTANSIEDLTDDQFVQDVAEDGGYMKMVFCKEISKEAKLLMDSFVLGLQGLQEIRDDNNEAYIKIIFKEV